MVPFVRSDAIANLGNGDDSLHDNLNGCTRLKNLGYVQFDTLICRSQPRKEKQEWSIGLAAA
jgi:hypothetical protein